LSQNLKISKNAQSATPQLQMRR